MNPLITPADMAEFRAMAESLMVDTCTITRAGVGKGEFNSETGQYDLPARIEIYSGKCRLQVTSIIAGSSKSDAGERQTIVQAAEIQLPVAGTESVSIDDVAEMTSTAFDAAHVGRKLTVAALHAKTHATSRRLRVQEVIG